MTSGDATDASSQWGGIIELHYQQLLRVAVFGFGVGLIAWIAYLLLADFALVSLLCGDAKSCGAADTTANVITIILASVVGLLGLVRLQAYRPIIIVVASAVCLWPLAEWTATLFWLESLAWYGVLYALMFAMFSWFVRPRSLVVVLIVVAAVVAAVRLLSMLQ
jgi:hypothetical protein